MPVLAVIITLFFAATVQGAAPIVGPAITVDTATRAPSSTAMSLAGDTDHIIVAASSDDDGRTRAFYRVLDGEGGLSERKYLAGELSDRPALAKRGDEALVTWQSSSAPGSTIPAGSPQLIMRIDRNGTILTPPAILTSLAIGARAFPSATGYRIYATDSGTKLYSISADLSLISPPRQLETVAVIAQNETTVLSIIDRTSIILGPPTQVVVRESLDGSSRARAEEVLSLGYVANVTGASSDQSFLLVWEDMAGIKAARFDANGRLAGNSIRLASVPPDEVNLATSGSSIAVVWTGTRYLAVWTEPARPGAQKRLRGIAIAETGAVEGDSFSIDSDGSVPFITGLGNGAAAVGYRPSLDPKKLLVRRITFSQRRRAIGN